MYPMAVRPHSEIECQREYPTCRAQKQAKTLTGRIIQCKIERIAAGIVAPDGREFDKGESRWSHLFSDHSNTRMAAGIVSHHSIPIHETPVACFHNTIAVFALTPVEHIIGIGQPNLVQRGDAI